MIEFSKFHGAGNDFVLVDNRESSVVGDKAALAQAWCKRSFGIGSDGVIFLENWEEGDFRMLFYNPDGSQSFCGNGARCAVLFAHQLGMIGREAHFLAVDGSHRAAVQEEGIAVSIRDVAAVEHRHGGLVVHTGSPHYVLQVEEVASCDILSIGRKIRYSPPFKAAGINVNAVQQIGSDALRVRTYERGVERETYACGTGVTAAVLAQAHLDHLSGGELKVEVVGGELSVRFERSGAGFAHIWLKGPAVEVFKGKING